MKRGLKYALGLFVLVAVIAIGLQYADDAKTYIEGKAKSELENSANSFVDKYSQEVERQSGEQIGQQFVQP
jgi:hypothetical protein